MKEGQYKIKDDNKIKEYMFFKNFAEISPDTHGV